MKVLISAASKHGATQDIAERLGERLLAAGIDTDVAPVSAAAAADGYDAVVLGSGVYAGSWLKDAREYIDRNEATLAAMPVWLFSSGPLGDPLKPAPAEAVNIDEIIDRTKPAGHELMAGALRKAKLSLGERAIVKVVRAPEGDFRDWAAIDNWADEIAETLAP